MPIGLHHLRYFVAVAEEGHVTRAAQRLRIAQPSLSAQIRYLERQVGAPLFRRHPRGVELTPAGEAFLAEARAALAAADAAVAAARRATQPSHLRLGLIVGTQIEVTSTVLYAYRSRHDGVVPDLVEHSFADPSAGLNGGEVDVAFVMPPFAHEGLRFETLWSAPRVAVLPTGHPLAGRAAVSVRELFDEPWIVADTDDQVCRDWWLAATARPRPSSGSAPARSTSSSSSSPPARSSAWPPTGWRRSSPGRASPSSPSPTSSRRPPPSPGGPAPPTRWWTGSSLSPARSAMPSASPPTSTATPPGRHADALAIVAVLGPFQGEVHQVDSGVGGALQEHGEVLGLALGNRLEDVVGRVLAAGRAADADADPEELRRAERLDDVLQAVVAGRAAAAADLQLAGGQVDLVVDDDDPLQRRLVPAGEQRGRPARLVDVAGRPGEHDALVAVADLGHLRAVAGPLQLGARPLRQPGDHHRPGVVPGARILVVGVAQTDDEPGSAVQVHRGSPPSQRKPHSRLRLGPALVPGLGGRRLALGLGGRGLALGGLRLGLLGGRLDR